MQQWGYRNPYCKYGYDAMRRRYGSDMIRLAKGD